MKSCHHYNLEKNINIFSKLKNDTLQHLFLLKVMKDQFWSMITNDAKKVSIDTTRSRVMRCLLC